MHERIKHLFVMHQFEFFTSIHTSPKGEVFKEFRLERHGIVKVWLEMPKEDQVLESMVNIIKKQITDDGHRINEIKGYIN